ncbi:MAG: UxaA family hydrolase, partial [Gemmatimonadota bacterium]
ELPAAAPPPVRFAALRRDGGHTIERVGLVLPTSLCSAQIARLAGERLTARGVGRAAGVERFAALVHTEGCGVSGGPSEEMYARILLGYLTHPLVHVALLLEHGCEKTHNDYMRSLLEGAGIEPEGFGWASVQLDGGIAQVLDRVEGWFAQRLALDGPPVREEVGLGSLRLGMLAAGPLPAAAAAALALLARWVVSAGGTVVVGDGSLAQSADFRRALLPPAGELAPTLRHGEVAASPGFHVMARIGEPWVEALTGLGASGVEIILGHAGEHSLAGHPLVPVVQTSADPAVASRFAGDLDVVLAPEVGSAEAGARALLECLVQVAGGAYRPRLAARGHTDFQISRGPLGVSL